jgi:hypothetical protein
MTKRIAQIFMICFFIAVFHLPAGSQTTTYNQLCNEVQLARTINDKWAGEIYLGGVFSSTPTEKKVLKTSIQRYVSGWAHYYLSPRWKLTSGLAYYYNKDVPDIGQYFSPEWRLSMQGIYYIHKTGFTLTTRMRGEIRVMMNEEGVYEDKYRYRQMIKYLQPLNGKVLRKGVVYLFSAEELLFKPNAKSEGITFFDRNRFEIGAGYLFTDNIQLELAYLNEFMPRDDFNEMYNALEITLTFNNPLTNLKNAIFHKPADSDQDN